MPERELFLLFVRPLNKGGIRYIVSGGIAAIFYGEPRLTHDVDLVVLLNERDVNALGTLFPAAEFFVPDRDTITAQASRQPSGQFNLVHLSTGFKADFYLTGRDDLNAWGFRNKRIIQYEGENVILAPSEYVIVRKLEFFREGGSDKHVRDIRSMLAVSGGQIDRGVLKEWIQIKGVQDRWDQVQKVGLIAGEAPFLLDT